MIPIPIVVPTADRIDFRVESVPGQELIPESEPDPGVESAPINEKSLLICIRSSWEIDFSTNSP